MFAFKRVILIDVVCVFLFWYYPNIFFSIYSFLVKENPPCFVGDFLFLYILFFVFVFSVFNTIRLTSRHIGGVDLFSFVIVAVYFFALFEYTSGISPVSNTTCAKISDSLSITAGTKNIGSLLYFVWGYSTSWGIGYIFAGLFKKDGEYE